MGLIWLSWVAITHPTGAVHCPTKNTTSALSDERKRPGVVPSPPMAGDDPCASPWHVLTLRVYCWRPPIGATTQEDRRWYLQQSRRRPPSSLCWQSIILHMLVRNKCSRSPMATKQVCAVRKYPHHAMGVMAAARQSGGDRHGREASRSFLCSGLLVKNIRW